MLPPYRTTFAVQSYLKMPVAIFPVHTKHIHFNIILTNSPTSYFLWRFITQLFCVKYRVFKSRFYSTSVALFIGLGTIREKCFVAWLCVQSGRKLSVRLSKKGAALCWKWTSATNQTLQSSTPTPHTLGISSSCAVHSFTDISILKLNDTSDGEQDVLVQTVFYQHISLTHAQHSKVDCHHFRALQ
jgi:hypothetical protein